MISNTMEVKVITLVVIICTLCYEPAKTQQVESLKENSGLYYEPAGILQIYPLKWKVISYVDTKPTNVLWESTKRQIRIMRRFCTIYQNENWFHYTDCEALNVYAQKKMQYITNLNNLVQEYMKNDVTSTQTRQKRGLINLVGEAMHMLFGTLANSDAETYNKEINQLEKEQGEFLHLAKEQMTVIKSAISSINTTVIEINQNEQNLRTSLRQLIKFTRNVTNEINKEIRLVNYINENVRLILRGLEECQHGYEILIESFVHAAQGALQPQLLTIEKIKGILKENELPTGMEVPKLPLSQLQKLITPITYSSGSKLVYILLIPLLDVKQFELYRIFPMPNQRSKNVYVFISSNIDYIFADSLRQRYGKLTQSQWRDCIEVHRLYHVCKASVPISQYDKNDCEIALLHPSTQVMPESCEIRLVTLHQTLWIPLIMSNEWIYCAPRQESIRTICNENPKTSNLIIDRTGILQLSPGCVAFTNHITLQTVDEKPFNASAGFLPTIPINYDCCIDAENTDRLSEIVVDAPLNNLMNNVNDLKIASIKIDEVDNLIKEQERKIFSSYVIRTTSWLTVSGSVILIIMCTCCCCCCNRSCRSCLFWLIEKCKPSDCWKDTKQKLHLSFFQPLPGSTLNINTGGNLSRQLSTRSLSEDIQLSVQPSEAVYRYSSLLQNESSPLDDSPISKNANYKPSVRKAIHGVKNMP